MASRGSRHKALPFFSRGEMPSPLHFGLLVFFLLAPSQALPYQSGAPWPRDGQSNNNTNVAAYALGSNIAPSVLWSAALAGGTSCSSKAPIIANDSTIYVACSGRLFAIAGENGTIQWVFSGAAGILSPPTLSFSGTIFFASDAKSVYALNSFGTQNWVAATAYTPRASASVALSPDGLTLYVATANTANYHQGRLDAFVASTGAPAWSFATLGSGGAFETPTVAMDGTIFYELMMATSIRFLLQESKTGSRTLRWDRYNFSWHQ